MAVVLAIDDNNNAIVLYWTELIAVVTLHGVDITPSALVATERCLVAAVVFCFFGCCVRQMSDSLVLFSLFSVNIT